VTGRVGLPVEATPDNLRYLIAKRDRLGHHLDGLTLPEPPGSAPAANGRAGTVGLSEVR